MLLQAECRKKSDDEIKNKRFTQNVVRKILEVCKKILEKV